MSRIHGVAGKNAGPLVKLAYWIVRRRYGAVPEPIAVSAHHPKLMRASAVHELLVERSNRSLESSVRELAVYRAAVRVGCSWCVDFGTMLQLHEGLDIERLKTIGDYADSPLFGPRERIAIAYADSMTATPPTVDDEQVAELERVFGRAGLVELTYAIGLENLRSRMNHALGITDQGFTSGEACRVS